MPRRAAVLTGGWGLERTDYLPSAQALAQTLIENKWTTQIVDVRSPTDLTALTERLAAFDFTFICHAEDVPTVQLLEDAGLPCSAPAPWTSIVASYDKYLSYQIARTAGVPPPDFSLLTTDNIVTGASNVVFPCIVKPVRGGSSYGIARANDSGGLEGALRLAMSVDTRVLVEKFLDGEEYTVGAIGDQIIGALQIGDYAPGFYDYHVKHHAAASFNAVAPDYHAFTQLSVYTRKLAEAFQVTGFWRADYRTDGETIHLLDINLLPFLARFEGGMMAALMDSAGLSFHDFLERLSNI